MASVDLPADCAFVQIPSMEGYGRSGIYFLLCDGVVVYVGQAINMRRRIGNHLAEGAKRFDSVTCLPCPVSRLNALEKFFIAVLLPRYNACRFSGRIQEMVSLGWDRLSIEQEIGEKLFLNTHEAALCLGLTVEELVELGDSGPHRTIARKPKCRSRYQAYPASALIAFANERAAKRAA